MHSFTKVSAVANRLITPTFVSQGVKDEKLLTNIFSRPEAITLYKLLLNRAVTVVAKKRVILVGCYKKMKRM